MSLLSSLFGKKLHKAAATPLAEIREHFNQAAADEEHFPSTIDPRIYHVKLVLEHLGDMHGKRVIDLGCGKGRFARVMKERHPDALVVGMDLAEAMLVHLPEGVSPVAATLTALPFADASFDGTYATESLEHAVDIEGAVAELCRVTRPGGRIVVIDKDAKAWGRLKTPEWERWFGKKELEGLLGRHCREVSSKPISYWDDVEPDGLFRAWLAVR